VLTLINPSQEARQIIIKRANKPTELLIENNGVNLLAPSHVHKLRRREPGIHEQDASPELAGRDHGVNRTTMITSQQRDNRPTPEPVRGKRPGQRVRPGVKFLVGERPEFVDQPNSPLIPPSRDLRRPSDRPKLAENEQ
jgi:hypothetical protein